MEDNVDKTVAFRVEMFCDEEKDWVCCNEEGHNGGTTVFNTRQEAREYARSYALELLDNQQKVEFRVVKVVTNITDEFDVTREISVRDKVANTVENN